MDFKKLAPWNWFKNEEDDSGSSIPVKHTDSRVKYHQGGTTHPILQLQREMDRLFDEAFRGFGLSPFRAELFPPLAASGLLKPQVDIGANDQEYSITIEVPGVEEKDVKIEVADNIMTIRGEKKQEKEEKSKDYYRVERSYGSFQRDLSLPHDASQEDVKAKFKNGVLTITIPRKALPKSEVKQIEIKGAD